MRILWTMIKVLGLILLWLLVILLSLILLAVLSVVFAPVRYDIQGEGSTRDGTYNGKGTVWWLFHLVHVTASIEKEGQRFGIYVLGIPIYRLLAGKRDRGKKQEEMPADGKSSRQEGPEPSPGEEPWEPSPDEESWEPPPGEEPAEDETWMPALPAEEEPSVSGKESSPAGEAPEEEEFPADVTTEDDSETDPGDRRRRLADRIREWYDSLRMGMMRAVGNVRAVYERTGSARETAAWYMRLWNEENTVAARKLAAGELRCLLRHWKPRKVEGEMVFGLGDPADTGFALALLALVYPASNGRLSVSPDFDRAVLEGRLRVKGHMRLFWPLKSAVRLFIAPEIRATYHKWQTRKDG